tara:strand:+ start:856 stop:4158 length:3303 start_codon:yes stop_codon:yes gene_type:complete
VDRLNAEEEQLKRQQANIRRQQAIVRRQQARVNSLAERRKAYYKEKRGSSGKTYDKADYKLLQEANKIKKEDLKKYEDEVGVFIMDVRVDYDCRQKADNWTIDEPNWKAPFRAYRSEIVIANTLPRLKKKAENMADGLKEGLENKSPELNNNFKVRFGKHYNSNNRVPISRIRMRNAEPLKLNDAPLSNWDMGTGRCVYDALISLWEQPNSKMGKKANYEWLNNYFTSDENPTPEEDGVSIEELYRLVCSEKISMYAFNIDNKLIKKHKEKQNNNKPPLIFRIYNNHIYTIDGKEQQMSLIAKNREGEKVRHNQLENDKKKFVKEDETTYNNVIATDEITSGNEFAVKYIFENKSVPFPMTKHNIKYDKGHIKQMTIGNNKIFTQPVEKDITDYLKKNKLDYKGQHYITLLMEFWKDIYGGELHENKLISEMNPDVCDKFNMDDVKNRVHIGSMMDIEDMDAKIESGEIVGADVIKCYSSILDNPADNWLVYSITDEITDYEGELKTGLYFVKTKDLTILHKNNWYSNTILKYATENNIEYEIIKQYIPTEQTNNKDYFKEMIDYVSKECGMKLTKNIINSITGMLGKTKQSSYTTSITTDINEVWECLNANNDKVDDFFLKQEKYDETRTLYIYGFKNKREIFTNNLPMYIQILDQSNIKLHQLQMKMGGELVYRKTDAVVVLGGKNITECDKTIRSNWGKETILSKEEMKLYNFGFRANDYRGVLNPFGYEGDDWKWNQNLTSSSQYKEIIEYAIKMGGLLCCSRAGTGKSYMVQQAVKDKLIEDDKRCRLAFTNKARRNIDGSTIHSAISINGDTEKASIKMVENYKGKKVIIVDEVSMISKQLWTYLILLKRVSGAVFILLGDYRQLPAVEDKEHDYFDSSIMKFLTNNNRIELLERQRYDLELWNWLDDFYEDGIIGDNLEKVIKINYEAYNICYYNRTRERVNRQYMNHFKTSDAVYLGHIKRDDDDKASDIYIYENLPVMAIVNKLKASKKSELKQALYCNSDTMRVVKFNKDIITMKLDIADEDGNDIVEVKYSDFHKSFVCNYCSTTHKNQGATISQKIQLWDWSKMTEDRRIAYTAVSRGKTIQQIKIVV